MPRLLTILLAAGLLTACGEPAAPPASQDAPAAPASAAAPETPALPATDEAPPATAMEVADEPELVYEPINLSKLDNSWWLQYSAAD